MPTLIPAIVAGEIDLNGNSYVTLEEANEYFDGRLNSSKWAEQDEDNRARALLTVIQVLDRRNWIGGIVREDQPLIWPRVAIRPIERRSRRLIRTGFETLTGATAGLYDTQNRYWASTAIPKPIKAAQCELAFALMFEEFSLDGEDEVKSLQADNVAVTFERVRKRTDLPLAVQRLIAPLLMAGVETYRG